MMKDGIQFTKDPYIEDVGPRKMWLKTLYSFCFFFEFEF